MAWSEEASHYTTRLGNRTTPARSRLGCAFARPANRRTEDSAVPISVYASDPKESGARRCGLHSADRDPPPRFIGKRFNPLAAAATAAAGRVVVHPPPDDSATPPTLWRVARHVGSRMVTRGVLELRQKR